MSGFAVEEQTQPHLINNIIVLLHTAIKTHPPPATPSFPFSSLSFYFRLWQRAVLWHGWAGVTLPPSTATKHKSRARRLRQTALQQAEDIKISWDTYIHKKNKKSYCILKYTVHHLRCYFLCNYEIYVTWIQNKSSARLQQVKHRRVKFTLHLSFKKRHQSINHESRGRVCVHTVNLRISSSANLRVWFEPSHHSVHFDWWSPPPPPPSSFRRQTITKAVTPHVSKLLIEDKQ